MSKIIAGIVAILIALPLFAQEVGKLTLGGPVGPDGKTEVVCDLPVDQRMRNVGSKLDGAGMCVFSSGEMALRYQGVENYRGWRDWCASKYPGGGYPEKVTKLMTAYAKAKNVALPDFVQYEGRDPAIIKAALATGRMPCITYNGHDPHYRGSIAHMICCVGWSDAADLVVCLDNNFIGPTELIWMSRKEFMERWTGGSSGWCLVYLAPPPPPPPCN